MTQSASLTPMTPAMPQAIPQTMPQTMTQATTRALIRTLVAGLLGAIALGSSAQPSLATSRITWDDLIDARLCQQSPLACDPLFRREETGRLKSSDEIRYQITEKDGIQPTQVELAFQSKLEWWKEVKVVNAKGEKLVSLDADDLDTRIRRTTLDVEWIKGGKLVFVKAGPFGSRREVYELALDDSSLDALAGKSLMLIWVRD